MSISSTSTIPRDAVSEPAEPGTYGLAPSGFRLPEDVQLGPARLQVADLDRSLEYYQNVIGLELLDRQGRSATLGAGPTTQLVELRERRGARPAPDRGRTGLYHFALLLPDRPSLGRFARHLQEIGQPAGSADHFVSEAFYLRDPDHLGIEVYADRPRTAWRRIGRELTMGTERLDLEDLLRAGGDAPWTGVPAGTVIGHVHLHVADLNRAAKFFSETLGFDRMVTGYPGALFLGAGGYHHHLGTNTWAGPQASPPAEEDARLLEWTIVLPDAASLTEATESLGRQGVAFERVDGDGTGPSALVRDPWRTAVRLEVGIAV